MKSVRLLITGQFEEAWLYMNHMLLLTDDGVILIASVDEIRDRLMALTSSSQLVGDALFHSDFIYPSTGLQHMWANRRRDQFRAELPALPESQLELAGSAIDWAHVSVPSKADTPLDLHIYNRRLFLGSAGGLFATDVDWGDERGGPDRWRLRVAASCLSVAAKYGAFVASCGSEGLLTAVEDFDWLAPYDIPTGEVHKVRGVSRKARWIASSLVNYAFDHVEVLRADKQLVDEAKSIQVLRGFAEESIDVDDELRRTGSIRDSDEDGKVVANAGPSFLLSSPTHPIRLASISPQRLRFDQFVVRKQSDLDLGQLEPLDVLAIRDGLLIEHYSGVIWLRDTQAFEVIPEAVGKVRTFPSSIRYRNVFTAILDQGVVIAGLFDESRLEAHPGNGFE